MIFLCLPVFFVRWWWFQNHRKRHRIRMFCHSYLMFLLRHEVQKPFHLWSYSLNLKVIRRILHTIYDNPTYSNKCFYKDLGRIYDWICSANSLFGFQIYKDLIVWKWKCIEIYFVWFIIHWLQISLEYKSLRGVAGDGLWYLK